MALDFNLSYIRIGLAINLESRTLPSQHFVSRGFHLRFASLGILESGLVGLSLVIL